MVERSVGIGVLEVSEKNIEGMVSITYETTLPENRKLNTLTWNPYGTTSIDICLPVVGRGGTSKNAAKCCSLVTA